jgi:hypothetical protein
MSKAEGWRIVVDYMFIIWEGGDAEEAPTREEMMTDMAAYAADLAGKGKLKGGAPLLPSETGASVRKRKGKITAVDGPYTETKEVVGGYFVVEADSLEEAVELAKPCPAAGYGGIEIRPIISMD